MCVIAAMLLPRDHKTGKPTKDAKWRLAKIRDRSYDPIYTAQRMKKKDFGASQIYLIDNETDWTEGISITKNETYLSLVNSALLNGSDKKDKGKSDLPVSQNGKIIRETLKQKNIDKAKDYIIENKFDGCTLLTDGDRLFVIEASLPDDVYDEYVSKVPEGKRLNDIVPAEKYQFEINEIKKDYLVVRTNHGVMEDEFGYQEDDGQSYKSSHIRRNAAYELLDKYVYEPLDLITTLSKMGRDNINDNPYYRPLRLKGKAINTEFKKGDPQYFSTSVVQTDPSGTMIVKPIECSFDIKDPMNLIDKKYDTHLVILPHRSKMFESFKLFNNLKEILL